MFTLTDPIGTAPRKAPFTQSVSTGVPWHNLPVTREYTLGQLLDQTVARCPSVYSRVIGRLCHGTPVETDCVNGAFRGAVPNGSVSLNIQHLGF